MLLLTCSKLLTRLFLIKGWIYKKKTQKDFAGGKEVLDFIEGGGGISTFGEKMENSIPNQKGQAIPQEFPSLCPHFQIPVPVSEFTFRAVTAG